MTNPPVVVCLTTHNRVDCARINLEILKLNYAAPLPVVHACSGGSGEPYLEDVYVRCEPLPLQKGAINLLQKSVQAAVDNFNPQYIVHLEADTWILDEKVIARLVSRMDADRKLLLATSAWASPRRRPIRRLLLELRDLKRYPSQARERLLALPARVVADVEDFSTQFFIIRNEPRVLDTVFSLAADDRHVERGFFDAFTRQFSLDRVLRMREREPVVKYRYMCEALHLYCRHWPAAGTAQDPRPVSDPYYVHPEAIGKKEVLQLYPDVRSGEGIQKLLQTTNLDYYNRGAIRY